MYKEVTISLAECTSLLKQAARLERLEINGVDSWSYYGYMCVGNMEEDGCIFCAEDEDNFL